MTGSEGKNLHNQNNCNSNHSNDVFSRVSITKLPIVVKGILRPDDAELAVQHGVSAIGVSNHGGRQLDGVQATVYCVTKAN